MYKQILIIAAVLSQVVVAINQIRHLEQNRAYLVDTGSTNWALSSPSLAQNTWKTVSLNKDKIVIWTSDCQSSVKSPQELSSNEKSLINSVRDQLNGFQAGKQTEVQQQQLNVQTNIRGTRSAPNKQIRQNVAANNQQQSSNYAYSSTNSIDGSQSKLVADHPIDSLTYDNQQITIDKSSESFSIAKPGLPNNLAQVFVDNDLITYVYLNGEVSMKPTSCLQAEESEFLKKLKSEVQQSQKQMEQYWSGFNQNMQQNMQNMHQNMMQNMQQDLNRNLMNMFPFMPNSMYQQPFMEQSSYKSPDFNQQTQQFGQAAPYSTGNQFQQPSPWVQNQMQARSATGYNQYPYLAQFAAQPGPYANPNFFGTMPGFQNFPYYAPF